MRNRHFIFLQGMPCSFFSELASSLQSNGAKVSRINLCFADWLFWKLPDATNYRGSLKEWPSFFEQFIERHGITDLILVGEQRKYHKEAVAVAKAKGLRVTVTDFGYLRPDWITFEQNGMSGNSCFPKDPALIEQQAKGLKLPDLSKKYQDSNFAMGLGDIVSMYGNLLLWFLYPHYQRSDARPHPLIYNAGGLVRSLTNKYRNRNANSQFAKLKASEAPYFVYPLQLEHDFQLIAYSPFKNQSEAIEKVIASFATSPAAYALIIKSHPWDPGLKNWRKVTQQLAKKHQCAERIHYLDGGNLDEMMQFSKGVITINSTSGIKALQFEKPVKVLGQAIYAVDGLTHQGNINDFWRHPIPPEPKLLDNFLKLLASNYQIRGSFFCQQGRTAAVCNAKTYLETRP